MVVNHVENYADVERVSPIDKRTHVVWRAVQLRRGEPMHAVVSPAKLARKRGHRHYLNERDADLAQVRKLFDRRSPSAFRRKRANMQFINYLPWHLHALPALIAPRKFPMIDHLRWPVNAQRLKI